jgi:hypothetical protein
MRSAYNTNRIYIYTYIQFYFLFSFIHISRVVCVLFLSLLTHSRRLVES